MGAGQSFNQSPLTYTVTLPALNGVSRVFTLQMDGVGDLLQVNYPEGGYTKYDYQDLSFYHVANIQACSRTERQVAHRRECRLSNGSCSSNQELVTTYTPTRDGSYPYNDSMAIQDPLGDMTFVQNTNFGAQNNFAAPHETSRQIFPSGQYPNGTPLRTIQTAYTPYIPTVDVQVPSSVTTTLNDLQPSLSTVTNYQYQTVTMSFSCLSGCGPTAQVAIDNPTETDEYDYGAFNPAKKTAQTWMTGGIYDIAQGHILDRLASRTVTDPVSGVQETLNYGYNSVGDITSKTVGGTGVTSLTTSYQRDSYGNITQMTDPKNNVTNFSYMNNWADSYCSGLSPSAYLTSITDALNQVTKFSYFSCTGLKASAQDPNDLANNRAGTTFTYDALGRTTRVSYPDTGSTAYTYVDTTPISITQSSAISSGVNRVDQTIVDGVGRSIETLLTSDPDCATGDRTDTSYDSLGRIYTVSNPYCTTSDPTYGITTYAYDALDRTTQITNPDNSVVTSSYLGAPLKSPTNPENQEFPRRTHSAG